MQGETRDIGEIMRAAGAAAASVDAEGRPPTESVEALRATGLLCAGLPGDLGGLGWDLRTLADTATTLAMACSSTALVWAMQQSQLATIARHTPRSEKWLSTSRTIAARGLLVASAVSEPGSGGALTTSAAALAPRGRRLVVAKEASTVSYGSIADAFLISCRRSPTAPANDVVLAYVERARCNAVITRHWDALGMRGTASVGMRIEAEVGHDAVLQDDFGVILRCTMTPVAHVLWSACWIGVASVAVDRARAYLRSAPRAAAAKQRAITDAAGSLDTARALLADVLQVGDLGVASPEASRRLNHLKIQVSTLAMSSVLDALGVLGTAGYLHDGEWSITRQVRDILSAPLMVGNHRLTDANAELELLRRGGA